MHAYSLKVTNKYFYSSRRVTIASPKVLKYLSKTIVRSYFLSIDENTNFYTIQLFIVVTMKSEIKFTLPKKLYRINLF